MKATLLLHERYEVGPEAFAEIRIWRVPQSVSGSTHDFKYSLAYVVRGTCVLRYDNEAGKGDHKHDGVTELPYRFISARQLIEDFARDVEGWRAE